MLNVALIALLKKSSFGRGLFGVMRVSAYAAAVGVVGSVVMVHQAKAAIGENSLVLARDLLPMADLLKDGHTLNLNGQRIHIATTVTADTQKSVLDRYETACKTGAQDVVVWHQLPDPNDASKKASQMLSSVPIVRTEGPSGGAISCFVKGEAATRSLPNAISEFFKTGELGTIGKLRYVAVGPSGDSTGVITAWTDDSFNVNALAPADGVDAPGADPVNLPRPGKSNRILSGGLEGMPYGVYMYTTSETPASAIADYDVQMAERKWTTVKSFYFEKTAHVGQEIRGYLNTVTGVQVFVACAKLDNGKTGIGISESRDFENHQKLPNPGDDTKSE